MGMREDLEISKFNRVNIASQKISMKILIRTNLDTFSFRGHDQNSLVIFGGHSFHSFVEIENVSKSGQLFD
jgi:hypothetical protein